MNVSSNNFENKQFLTLVIPILNEGVRIIPVLSTLFLTTNIPLSILIVYDFDNDTTLPIIKDLSKTFPNIRTVKNKYQKLNGAIRTGFEECNSDIVGVWLAYHVDPFGLIDNMYDLISNHECVLVSGNRFNSVKRVSRGPIIKKLLSRTANFILNRLIGIPLGDITTSIKMFRLSFIRSHPIETTVAGGWALSTELAVKAAIDGEKLGDIEFKPENVNLIHGVTNFKVLKYLRHYFRWLMIGFQNREIIKKNYYKGKNFVCK